MQTDARTIRVLLVKDSAVMLWGLGRLVAGEAPRMTLVGSARTAAAALAQARLYPHVIVLDLELEGASSVDLIPALRERSGGRVLIHTGIGDRRLHEDAMLFGAAGILAADAPAEAVLDAIVAVHAGRPPLAAAPTVSRPRGDAEIAAVAAAGIAFLSPAERRAIARLRGGASLLHPVTPPALADLVAIYSKLGLRNRRELERFATRFA